MEPKNYKYDVAFSFLAQDESLATQVNDLLQERLKTFLYSEHQKEIAGKDGEKIFAEVFGEEARIVVVFYRSGWGDTPWTRIEDTAIRNRAFKKGYEFAIFIPLDDPPLIPEWVPKTRLWIGINRWGVNGAAIAIETLVQEKGGEPHEETVIERAARLKRSLEFQKKRDKFRNSFEGIRIANVELTKLKEEFIQLIDKVNQSTSEIKLHLEIQSEHEFTISGLDLRIKLYWKCQYNNSLNGSGLCIVFFGGDPALPDIIRGTQLLRLGEVRFNFDMMPTGDYRWIACSNRRLFSSKDLGSYIIKLVFDKIQEIRNNCLIK